MVWGEGDTTLKDNKSLATDFLLSAEKAWSCVYTSPGGSHIILFFRLSFFSYILSRELLLSHWWLFFFFLSFFLFFWKPSWLLSLLPSLSSFCFRAVLAVKSQLLRCHSLLLPTWEKEKMVIKCRKWYQTLDNNMPSLLCLMGKCKRWSPPSPSGLVLGRYIRHSGAS